MKGLEGQCQREGCPVFLFNPFLGEDIEGQRAEKATPWVRNISFNVSLQNSPHSPSLRITATSNSNNAQHTVVLARHCSPLCPGSTELSPTPWWNRGEHKEGGWSRHICSRSISVLGHWQALYMTNGNKKGYPRDAVFGEIKLQIY